MERASARTTALLVGAACALAACAGSTSEHGRTVAAAAAFVVEPAEAATVRRDRSSPASDPAEAVTVRRDRSSPASDPGSVSTSGAPIEEASEPARRVLETAARMVEAGTVVRGSCYGYVDAVFTEAGHGGRDGRDEVFRGPMRGPYADLDRIRPGDWLFLVNHPERTPVGTHSVIFVEWTDRDAARAAVVSYVGGDADRPGDRTVYDVSRTYVIQRPVEPAGDPDGAPSGA